VPNIMFFVRGPDGKIRTIMSTSKIGAVNKFLRIYAVDEGSDISVKERGRGTWENYQAT